MPQTRRQVEADMGRRMSMVQQRKRSNLELERGVLLPPVEEATQSPPNVMMPPVMEGDGEGTVSEDEDLPLAAIRKKVRPESPPHGHMFQPMTAIQSIPPFDYNVGPTDIPVAPAHLPTLGPAFELKILPVRTTSHDSLGIVETPPLVVHHISAPPVEPLALPTPPPPRAAPQPAQPVTRTKRSKSLSAALSRSASDDARIAGPPMPILKKQKSLKKLFFPTSEAAPPIPAPQEILSPTERTSAEIRRDVPEGGTSKKSKLSRAKSKPSLRIEVKQPLSLTNDGGQTTPVLGTASSSGQSDAYPLTPATVQPVRRSEDTSADSKKAVSAGSIRGLSKRFSLSNMSGAFRKRSSISGMPLPVVPELPAVYKNAGPKGKSKGKGKEVDVDAVGNEAIPMPAMRRGKSFEIARERPVPERMSSMPGGYRAKDDTTHFEHIPDSPVAGPSRSSPSPEMGSGSLVNLIGLSTLGIEPFNILDSDYEFAVTSPIPAPSSRGGADAHGSYAPDSASSTITTTTQPMAMVAFERFPDPETSSISSCGSMDDSENTSVSIIHAQLMQVSPTTRRNPGVSLQEFSGMAPLPQTGVLIASPSEKRRSVKGVIIGPLLVPESSAREAVTVTVLEKARIEAGQPKKVEVEAKPTEPMVIDLRGQYLERFGPSGSKGAQQLLERPMFHSPTSPLTVIASSPLPESDNGCLPPPDVEAEVDHTDDTSSDDASEPEKEEVPATPLSEDALALASPVYFQDQPYIHDPEIDFDTEGEASQSQSSSVDSGLVFVEVPLPPSPPFIEPISRNTGSGSRASMPRSRFMTPEALLRLLASPLAVSRLSRTNTPSTAGSVSGKSKKGSTRIQVPVDLEGLPMPRDGANVHWSALLMETQLGSLHVDDLGLDLSFGNELQVGGESR